jgi:hypothetical protein
LFALTLFSFGACDVSVREETDLFQRAETRYARGDYDGASTLYTEFLELHPLSPLAPIADQRLDMIDREFDAIMGRRGSPAPVYVNPLGAPPDPSTPGFQIAPVRAPQIPTFK